VWTHRSRRHRVHAAVHRVASVGGADIAVIAIGWWSRYARAVDVAGIVGRAGVAVVAGGSGRRLRADSGLAAGAGGAHTARAHLAAAAVGADPGIALRAARAASAARVIFPGAAAPVIRGIEPAEDDRATAVDVERGAMHAAIRDGRRRRRLLPASPVPFPGIAGRAVAADEHDDIAMAVEDHRMAAARSGIRRGRDRHPALAGPWPGARQ